MNKRRKAREEKNRINEAETYGITLLDIKKNRSDNRVFLCLVRALLLFLAVYGTIVGVVASFELPFSVPIVVVSLFVLSLMSSFIYYNRITFYVGYVVIFLILIIMAFAFYLYINSGFQAFLNEVISRYETFFSIVSGRVAEEQITDRYLTVTAMLIFVGGVFSIFFNITISGYMDLPMTFIVSFLPLQIAFYIDIVPPRIYLIMLVCVYISVAVLGRSGHYTLPYRYDVNVPFGRRRTKKKQTHFYQASGMGMVVMLLYSLVFSTILMLLVGGIFSADFSTRKLSNVVKDKTDKYVKTAVVSGVTALFNRYDAVGGLAKGQLGGIRSVNPDYQTDLIVDYVKTDNSDMYLKAFTGVRYEKNRFYNTLKINDRIIPADEIISMDDYTPTETANIPFSKMSIENVGADKTYNYQPYIPFMTTDSGSPSKTGIAPKRTAYLSETNPSEIISLSASLKEDTYETVYLPLMGNVNYGADEPARKNLYEELYTYYPTYLEGTLSAISSEANLTNGITDKMSSKQRTIMMAENLRKFYEENFTYTYTPGATPINDDMVEYFLTKNRRGFCAHFAASATLIMRYMGVPARYCEGYLLEGSVGAPLPNAPSGVYEAELSDANAHSWVEIYVDDYGWIPYEMTPPSYETEESNRSLGFFGFFSGLFNRTERLVDDTDGSSIANALNNNANSLTDATGDALSEASSNGFVRFARSVGYLFIPFVTIIIVILVVVCLYILIKRIIFEVKRRRFIKAGNYNDALLLEYNRALKKWKKKKIVTIENPTVRDVEESLRSHIKNNDRMNKTITEEGLSELMDIVYCAAFSEIDISEEEYNRTREFLS